MTTIDQKRMLKLAGLLKEGVEEWIDEEENVAPTSWEDEEEEYKEWLAQSLHTHAGQDNEDLPVKEPVASAEEEELERMPKQMGMGRGAGLEETYIDNLGDGSVKESLEEAPPPSDPEERKKAGMKTLKQEKGPFGEELPRGKTFGAETLKANPGLVELHEVIRSLVREVLLKKIKKED